MAKSLREEPVALEVGEEGVFGAAIHGAGIFNGTVAIGVRRAPRQQYRAADGNAQGLRLRLSGEARFDLLLRFHQRNAELGLEKLIEGMVLEILLGERLASLEVEQ